MGVFKARKNKKFDYSPRYWNNEGEGSPYQIEHRFDKYRTTIGSNGNLKQRMATAWEEMRHNSDRKVNRRVLYIFIALFLGFLYLIDFDLSIFFTKE